MARCLLADPQLLILDEPTNGLDPAGIAEFRLMIRALVAEGRTVMLSSHQDRSTCGMRRLTGSRLPAPDYTGAGGRR